MPPPAPRPLFGLLARAEAVTWTLLLAGMLGKYVLDLGEWGVRIGGGLHGLVFLAYCLVALLVAVDARWRRGRLLGAWASAVVPYATIPFEQYAERHGLLTGAWRLREQRPGGGLEPAVAWAVRRPAAAVLLGVAAVLVSFAVLLSLGPPTQWFG